MILFNGQIDILSFIGFLGFPIIENYASYFQWMIKKKVSRVQY